MAWFSFWKHLLCKWECKKIEKEVVSIALILKNWKQTKLYQFKTIIFQRISGGGSELFKEWSQLVKQNKQITHFEHDAWSNKSNGSQLPPIWLLFWFHQIPYFANIFGVLKLTRTGLISITGVTPAEKLLELYNGKWGRNVDPVFEELLYWAASLVL